MIRLNGKNSLPGDPLTVWDVINDPEQIAPCLPGLKHMAVVEPGKQFVAQIHFGPFRVEAEVVWLETAPPDWGKMRAVSKLPGKGGSVLIDGDVNLSRDGADTIVSWDLNVQLQGGLLMFAKPLIRDRGHLIINQFFNCLRERIGQIEKR